MEYHHFFNPRAAEEYETAFKWYEEKSIVAADNLIVSVQEAIGAICTSPYRYRVIIFFLILKTLIKLIR